VPTIQALVEAGQVLWSPAEWSPEIEEKLGVTWRHAVATACLVSTMASPAHRPYAQAAALLQDVGRFVRLVGSPHGTVRAVAVDHHDAGHEGIPHREVGAELLHLWGLPPPIVTTVAERDLPHRSDAAGLGVAGAVRAAHLLVQRTEARDQSVGLHEDELTALLAHPQLMARGVDWFAAAERASACAAQEFAG
jgi:HD-like signal output (HDOD) protein